MRECWNTESQYETIHYQGKLGDITQKDKLIHELKADAKSIRNPRPLGLPGEV
jgi:hypothetical protein